MINLENNEKSAFLFSTLRLHLNRGLNLKTFLIYHNFTFKCILTIMEWKGFNEVPGQENQDWTINQYGQVQHPNHRSCNCFATQNVSQHTIINAALWCDRRPGLHFMFLQTNGTILWGAEPGKKKIMSLSSLKYFLQWKWNAKIRNKICQNDHKRISWFYCSAILKMDVEHSGCGRLTPKHFIRI